YVLPHEGARPHTRCLSQHDWTFHSLEQCRHAGKGRAERSAALPLAGPGRARVAEAHGRRRKVIGAHALHASRVLRGWPTTAAREVPPTVGAPRVQRASGVGRRTDGGEVAHAASTSCEI